MLCLNPSYQVPPDYKPRLKESKTPIPVVDVFNPLAREFKSIGTMKKKLADLQEQLAKAYNEVHILEDRVATALDKLADMEILTFLSWEYTTNGKLGSAHNNTGRDLLSCKPNKYHQMLDVEAALPPSKCLHRALEAMSANAAKAAIDCPQAPSKTEIKSIDCLDSLTESVHSGNESVRFPPKPLHMQVSGTAAFDDSACGLSSKLKSQNLASWNV